MSDRNRDEVRTSSAGDDTPELPNTSRAPATEEAPVMRSHEKSTRGGAPETAGFSSRGREREQSTLGDRMESPVSGPQTRTVPRVNEKKESAT